MIFQHCQCQACFADLLLTAIRDDWFSVLFFSTFWKENCPNLRELNLTGTNIRTFHIEKLQVGSQLCRVKCNNSTHFCICANSKLWVFFTITINLMIDLPTCSVVILLVFCRLAVPSCKNWSCLHCSFFLHRKLMKRYFVNKNTYKKEGLIIAKWTCLLKCLLSSEGFSAIALVAA